MNKIKRQQNNLLDDNEKTLLNVFVKNTNTSNKKSLSFKLKQLEINKSYPKLFNTILQIETKLGEDKAIKYLRGYDEFHNLNLSKKI